MVKRLAPVLFVLVALTLPDRAESRGQISRVLVSGKQQIQKQIHALKIPARLRLARTKIRSLKIPARLRLARRTINRVPLVRRTRHQVSRWGAFLTHRADQLETRLSPKLARAFHRLRLFSPDHLLAFTGHMAKRDKGFHALFWPASMAVSWVALPLGMTALGAGLSTTLVAQTITGWPINGGVLLAREHTLNRRANPGASLRHTLRGFSQHYVQYVEKRRAKRRTLWRELDQGLR